MTRLILEHARTTATPTMRLGPPMITDKIGPHHLERGAIPIRRGAARLRRRSRQRGIVSSLVGMPMRLAFGQNQT
jgi:hypothetical protein